MVQKGLGEVIDLTEGLQHGQLLDICGVSFDKAKDMGDFALIITKDGGKYRTFSEVVIKQLKAVVDSKFDFKKDSIVAQVEEKKSEATGYNYLMLIAKRK